MKILHIFDHSLPLHSGYTFRSQSILTEQAARGWETCHITSEKQGFSDELCEEVDGLKFYRTPARESRLWRMPLLKQWSVVEGLAQRLEEVVATEKPDVLHAHSPALNGMAALRAGSKWGLPVIYECRAFWEDAAANLGYGAEGGVRYRMSRALETYVFRKAHHVCCICEGLRQDIVARGVDPKKVTVVPNAVDPERFRSGGAADENLKDELGLLNVIVLGFIGSFYEYEGLDLVISAMPRLLRERPDVRLVLVGGGPQDAAWRKQVQAARLTDEVLFTGRIAHGDVGRYYGIMDVLLYPRHRMRLTDLVTPLKPLEAMAHGKMVVASDVGGHRELIRSGETGMLFRAGSVDDLIDVVVNALQDRPKWGQYQCAARAFVEQERSWRVSVDRYQRVYEQAYEASKRSIR